MISELHVYTFIRIFFGYCHVTFPCNVILSFVGHCHVTFLNVEPPSFFGTFVQKVIVSCFSDSFVQKTTQQKGASAEGSLPKGACVRQGCKMAAIMLQSIPSFYAKISEKSLFISATTYEKYIVCKDFCIAHHNDKLCFLPTCKYHIVLLEDVQELLKELDTFCFTYQHVDCLYTLFKYRFSGKNIAKSGQVFDNVQQAVYFNHRSRGVDRMPSIAKKRLLSKSTKNICSAPFKRQKQRRPVVQCLPKELKKLKRLNLKSN